MNLRLLQPPFSSPVRACGWILCLGMTAVLHAETAIEAAAASGAAVQTGWIGELLNGPEEIPQGSHLLLWLVLIALATLVTEDLTCVTTGLMIANGTLTWSQGIGACLFGILFGDFLLYLAGRKWGRPALHRIPLRWIIHPVKLLETEDWFRRRGGMAIFISRFVPGTRLPAYVAAGLMGMPVVKFTAFFVAAALLWTPALIFLANKLAGKALYFLDKYHHAAPWIFFGLVAAYLLILKGLIPALSWRGRRQLLSRWRRFTRPEYWPSAVLYFPVAVYLMSRWIRRGQHPMDFSACNPCMPGGGMVEESKSDILDRITDRDAVAEYILLPKEYSPDEKIESVGSFMRSGAFDFPVVLKPDVGQRGSQVSIAKSPEDVEQILKTVNVDFMAQAFVPGVEFGVFYIRHPEENQGRIFAITRKTFCVLTGDGVHNLEELILSDNRAMCQADLHFQNLQTRLLEVPEKGQKVQLTQVGNHCQGTLFEDGMDLLSAGLSERVEAISRTLPDFYFGRYDFIAPDEKAFQRGEGLKVIELNGVSSEATSLYDPANSYFAMVRTLLQQWREASSIGLVLQGRGHMRMKIRQLIHLYDQYLLREGRKRSALKKLVKKH